MMKVSLVGFVLWFLATIPSSLQTRDTNVWRSNSGQAENEATNLGAFSEPDHREDHAVIGDPHSMLDVQLTIQDGYVVMDNGIIQVTMTTPGGAITSIKYKDVDNVLESHNEEDNRGYWDLDWSRPDHDHSGIHDRIVGTNFTIIMEDTDQVELSFVRTWDPTFGSNLIPLKVDIRFVMLRGSSGLYSYAIYEHLKGWPDFDLAQTRMVFKLAEDTFHYMAISDDRQKTMPMPEDRDTGQPLAYKEAVRLTNPTNPELKGEVDDKYLYSCENKDCRVHGWFSPDSLIGFWTIIPSNEFQSNGPIKQDLTSHVGPITLSMFHSLHYSGEDVVMKFRDGEYWKKVFGPVFFYLNAGVDDNQDDPKTTLWENAKQQMLIEAQSWPYRFPVSEDYPYLENRGTISGRLLVLDRFVNSDYIPAESAYVGLATPGDVGSWQREGKGYQFWTKADVTGSFFINNVREGVYNIYAYVPGFIGDYKYDVNITITSGCIFIIGDLVYEPPRDGPTLWEIGIPDRSAAEYYVPEPNPIYVTKQYLNHPNSYENPPAPVDKFRQYGLWERYTELYPDGDIIYEVDISNYTNDWFYAHVNRNFNNTISTTTWQILFQLDSVIYDGGCYKLRIALASASASDLHVRVNDPNVELPLFRTGLIGRDNAIARHGIHGLYWLYSIDVPSDILIEGFNTIYLTQTRNSSSFTGVMYDYIRLEGP